MILFWLSLNIMLYIYGIFRAVFLFTENMNTCKIQGESDIIKYSFIYLIMALVWPISVPIYRYIKKV